MRERCAAVDFGSNTVGFLIGERGETGFQDVERSSRFVRLGQGVKETGVLGAKALDRTVDWVEEMTAHFRDEGVQRVRAVGTEAPAPCAQRRRATRRRRTPAGLRAGDHLRGGRGAPDVSRIPSRRTRGSGRAARHRWRVVRGRGRLRRGEPERGGARLQSAGGRRQPHRAVWRVLGTSSAPSWTRFFENDRARPCRRPS